MRESAWSASKTFSHGSNQRPDTYFIWKLQILGTWVLDFSSRKGDRSVSLIVEEPHSPLSAQSEAKSAVVKHRFCRASEMLAYG